MILAKGIAGTLKYLIASGATPPTGIQAQVYDLSGVALGSAITVTAPTAKTLSGIAQGLSLKEGHVAVTRASNQAAVGVAGDVVRIVNGLGGYHDAWCQGHTGQVTYAAEYGGDMLAPVASIWAPEVSIPIPAIDTCGDGYRVSLTLTYSGSTIRETLWFGVAPYPSHLDLSQMEYLAYHTESGQQLLQVQQRPDWRGLVSRACEIVEAKLRTMEKWPNSIISTQGHRRAIAAALHRMLAPVSVPNADANDPQSWRRQAEGMFAEAIRDLLGGAKYDATGDVASATQLPPATTSYKVM